MKSKLLFSLRNSYNSLISCEPFETVFFFLSLSIYSSKELVELLLFDEDLEFNYFFSFIFVLLWAKE